jgi:hypothetical protein
MMKFEAMLWVWILVSLAVAIVSSKYRRFALLAVGVAVAVIVTAIVVASKTEVVAPPPSNTSFQHSKRVDFEALHIEKLDKEDPEAKNRIAVSEIRFDQLRPTPGSDPRTIESIRARLYRLCGKRLYYDSRSARLGIHNGAGQSGTRRDD